MTKVVPSGAPISSSSFSRPPSITYLTAVISSSVLVISSTLLTAAIDDRASPLKPSEAMPLRSSTELILDVAWRRKARQISSGAMPAPSSVIRIILMPPSWISIVILVAPASMAFSVSSLTTDAGLSTTSPAAILSIVFWSNTCMLLNSLILSSDC